MFNATRYLLVAVLLTLSTASQASLIGDTLCFGMTTQVGPPTSSTCQNPNDIEILAQGLTPPNPIPIEIVELQLTSTQPIPIAVDSFFDIFVEINIQPEIIQLDFFGCQFPLQPQCVFPPVLQDAQQLQFDPLLPNPDQNLDDAIWSWWFTDLDWVGMDGIITGVNIHQPDDLIRVPMFGPHEIHLNLERDDIVSALISESTSHISIQVEILTAHDIAEPKTVFILAISLLILTLSNKRTQLKALKNQLNIDK